MHSRDSESVDLADAVLSVALTIRRRHAAALEPLGLSPWQSRALRTVGRSDAPLRLVDLAERLRIAPRSATEVVDALESDGLLQRTPDPADRRATLVALTDAGQATLERVHASQDHISADIFGRLDDDERAELRRLLDRALPESERVRRRFPRAAAQAAELRGKPTAELECGSDGRPTADGNR